MVGIQVSLFGIEAILSQSGLFVVKDFVTVVHLAGIEHHGAVDGVRHVDALDGALLVFVGLLPGYRFCPVKAWRDGVAVFVNLNFKRLVAAIGGVGQTLADDAVAHPVDELAIHGVGHFRLIHPEAVDTDVAFGNDRTPQGVVFTNTRTQKSTLHLHHAEGHGFADGGTAYAGHLAAVLHGTAAPKT